MSDSHFLQTLQDSLDLEELKSKTIRLRGWEKKTTFYLYFDFFLKLSFLLVRSCRACRWCANMLVKLFSALLALILYLCSLCFMRFCFNGSLTQASLNAESQRIGKEGATVTVAELDPTKKMNRQKGRNSHPTFV